MRPRLSRLYVDNYRCFMDFELRPERRSLLVGYNGTGKSSIFDLLASIQDLVARNKDASDVFPPSTVSALGTSNEQRFELDIDSDLGAFRYALHLTQDERHRVAHISSERVTLDGKHLYAFADGAVQMYDDEGSPARETFSFTPRRSFLASLEPTSTSERLTWFKAFIEGIWILRFDPARMTAAAPTDDRFLARDASNFAAWCRNLLAEAPDAVQRARHMLEDVIAGFESMRTQTVGRAKVLVVKFGAPGRASYELDFDALSDGQKVLIALYTILHGVAPTASILCLDEPDNFVSIREIQPFLVELANVSEDSGVQPLLISHSSEVIDYIGASDAILLERPDGAPACTGSLSTTGSLRLSELMARGWHVAA